MKKKSLLLISLSIFFIACKKENFRFDYTSKTDTPYITNPTSYVLKKQTWTGSTTNGQSFLYIYNTDHLVSKIERYEWGTYSQNGGPQQTWYDTSHNTFEYTN